MKKNGKQHDTATVAAPVLDGSVKTVEHTIKNSVIKPVQTSYAKKYAFGWQRDLPDFRDYTTMHDKVPAKLKVLGQEESIKEMLMKAGVEEAKPLKIPASTDLRPWCSPIEDQESIGSCTAQAGVGLIEYFERRAFSRHLDASRLFLYKVTRNLSHWTGDTGAYLRTTMGAMTLFGVPPEAYWPYDINNFDVEPTAFCYAFAQNYQSISYYRLDSVGVTTVELLSKIKTNLAAGLPSMFGFTVYNSIYEIADTGRIPYPTPGESTAGGHAVVAVGYDNAITITNSAGTVSKGALLIRNSWGTSWGEAGYGWLPYDYVLNGLAVDWWSLLKNEWIETGHFEV